MKWELRSQKAMKNEAEMIPKLIPCCTYDSTTLKCNELSVHNHTAMNGNFNSVLMKHPAIYYSSYCFVQLYLADLDILPTIQKV